ncbi:hypothetical protein ACFL6F_04075 [Planctomycetota bacterium]
MKHDIQIDIDVLPADIPIKGSKGLGLFLLVFSSFWGGIPTMFLISSIISGKFEWGMLMVLPFTIIGIVMFLIGLNQFFISGRIRIAETGVEYEKKSLFGSKEWDTPLNEYKGVLYRSEYHSGGKNSSSYTLYIVELYHEEKDKRIILYKSRMEQGIRQKWETSSRRIGLPALEKSGSEITERDVEDLDKSVKELVQERKIEIDFDPSSAPPAGLSAEVVDGELRITSKKQTIPVIGLIIMILIPSVFMYIGFFVDDGPVVMGVFGAVFLTIMLLVVIWTWIAQPQLRLSQKSVYSLHLVPWGETSGARLNPSDIEQVEIKVPQKGQGQKKAVVIITDDKNITFGQGLDNEVLEWLKNCILTVIST